MLQGHQVAGQDAKRCEHNDLSGFVNLTPFASVIVVPKLYPYPSVLTHCHGNKPQIDSEVHKCRNLH